MRCIHIFSTYPQYTVNNFTPGGFTAMDRPDQRDEITPARECAKTAARILDSVTNAALMSSWATPQMQDMFAEWLEIIDRQVISGLDVPGRINVADKAKEIGISGSTLVGMLLCLHRRGSISITDVGVDRENGSHDEICSCNKG